MVAWKCAWYYENVNFSAMPYKLDELSQIVQVTSFLSGTSVKLKLTNYYGKDNLVFDEVSVSLSSDMKDRQRVTHMYQDTIIIPKGESIWTDAIALNITVGQKMYVLLTSHHKQTYCDFKCTYENTITNATFSRKANFLPKLSNNWKKRKGWFCLEEVDVWTKVIPRYIEISGDSLMEMGMISSPIMQDILTNYPNEFVVLNTAISGSRLINDAPNDKPLYRTFGKSLLQRMKYNRSGQSPELILISIGANDLILPIVSKDASKQIVSVEEFLQSIQKLRDILAERNSELIMIDITPFELSKYNVNENDEQEIQKLRQSINSKLANESDVVVVSTKLEESGKLVKDYDFGDYMHINQKAGKILANALLPKIKEKLFN